MLAVRTRRLADAGAGATGPATGTIVDVTVDTNDTELDQQDVSEHGQAQRIELEGTVAAITPATATDPGEIVLTVGKSTISVVVPAGVTLPAIAVGDKIQLKATLAGDTFTLASSHQEDDNQGDDGDHSGGGGDHQGGGSGGGGGGDG
jgi:uncharacterized membrane protein YgcG